MKSRIILFATLLGRTAWSADITFDAGQNCTGQAMFGSKGLPNIRCYDVSEHGGAQSALIANLAANAQVKFYSDDACENLIGSVSKASCFSPGGQLGSFEVLTPAWKRASSDLAKSDVLLTNYTGLSVSTPDSMDLKISVGYVIAGLASIDVGFKIWQAYDSCHTAESKTAKDIINCVGGPVASACGYTALFLLGQRVKSLRVVWKAAIGIFNNARREDIDGHNFDYMSAVMNATDSDTAAGIHLGSMIRDMGFANHTSPLYEVDMGDGGKWHTSAFFDEATGDFVHHIRPAEESAIELAKRKAPMAYNSVKWNKGGLDFIICPHNTHAKMSGLNVGKSKIFNIFWDQIMCENSPAQVKAASHVKADIYNENLVVVGSIYMKPYKQKHVSLPACNNNAPLPPNQGCFVS